MDVAEPRSVELAPIPGFDEGLPDEERRAKWRWLVEQAVKALPSTKPVLGAEKVKKAHPQSTPKKPKRSPAPKIHTRDPAVRAEWERKYRAAKDSYGDLVRAVLEGRLAPKDFPREVVAPAWLRKLRAEASG